MSRVVISGSTGFQVLQIRQTGYIQRRNLSLFWHSEKEDQFGLDVVGSKGGIHTGVERNARFERIRTFDPVLQRCVSR